MGELVILGIAALIVVALVVCVLGTLIIRQRTYVALKREEYKSQAQIEAEKNDRILAVEELKNERTRLANEKTAIYANRDLVTAQLEAGVLGQQQPKEDEGLSGLIQQLLPIFMQNPNLLSSLSGLLSKNNAAGTPAAGGAAVNAASFPSGSGGST